MPADFPINQRDWDQTPQSVQGLIIALWQENRKMKQEFVRLQAEVNKLKERANKNSKNSSKPPSSDMAGKGKYPKKETSGKEPGGQFGHKGSGRKLKPIEEVSKIVVIKPIACCSCRALLMGEDANPERHQVSELPRIMPEIVEYQKHTLTCLACGTKNEEEWPAEMPKGSFGERIQAMSGYMSGRFGMSQRDMAEMFETVFHVEISLGSIPAQEQLVSQALKQPVEDALNYVQKQTTLNMDETSWHELSQLRWLWTCVTPFVTVFQIVKTRGASEAKKLLGENFTGTLGSDRYCAYNWLNPAFRQACWAHLKRDFQALLERGGESKTIGRLLLAQIKLFFGLWHRLKNATLSRLDFQIAMQPIRNEVANLLLIGTFVDHAQTRKTCKNIIQLKQALWTFVDREGVEPTNNAAERALRRSVIWRRRSFGTQSENGSNFVERIISAITTLRQQKRDVLDYLVAACHANLLGKSAPSLLPN